jgi:hypothetical protein
MSLSYLMIRFVWKPGLDATGGGGTEKSAEK